MAKPKKYATPEEAHRAKLESNRRNEAEKIMRIEIKPQKAEGQQIKDAASTAGQSTQQYVLQAVRLRMLADSKGQYLMRISKDQAQKLADRHGVTLAEWIQQQTTDQQKTE